MSLETQIALGPEVIQIGLPVQISGSKIEYIEGGQTTPDPKNTTQVDDVTWVPVQKAFGQIGRAHV